ncbi:Rad17 cell cycle checkpoint protein-domain-containing protein [Halteromyces radiatus]|uniref:Rad17 cell cycle checkpoint protein-domain-containing protein n=1 Tax=Halteromyces radiatus TaxID=101107 RepID=UPI00221F9BB6|nr:Rad17 cell cycle checkpoint protein-domain-containing protein [Halteromyces radiatus]KAI8093449.1 Rad17 cell cycle checkpoint protein-domain-containing protein [Halteromyces radiatus]
MSYNAPIFVLPNSSPVSSQSSFNRLGNHSINSSTIEDSKTSTLWTEKYTPLTEDELAVRTQKLTKIKNFIDASAISKRKGPYKILALTGPAGVGKSTSIRILAKSIGYDIIEWRNYEQQKYDPDGYFDPDYEPTMKRFSEFLRLSIQTGSLNTDHQQQRRKIILLDDLPDLTTSYIKHEFQQLLKNYVESDYAFLIVIVHSYAHMVTGPGRYRQSSMESQLIELQDIIPNDILVTGRCGIVEFNPIVKKTLKLVLSRILKCETRISRPNINQQQLDEIIESCHGDIRCSILTMQFYATKPSHRLPQKRKAGINNEEPSSIFGRDDRLDFFHAVGKVLYAKRTPSGALESKPIDILNNFDTDTDKYLGYLFTNHYHMTNNIDEITTTMNHLCDADMISGMGDWLDTTPLEYQLLISMHGIMSFKRNNSHISRKTEFVAPGEGYYRNWISKESPRIVTPIVTRTQDIISTNSNDMMDDIDEPIENNSDDEFDAIYGNVDDSSIFDTLDGTVKQHNSDDEFDQIYGDGDDLVLI